MKYLGHVFSAKRMLANEDKTEVVRNWAIANDVTKLRRFQQLHHITGDTFIILLTLQDHYISSHTIDYPSHGRQNGRKHLNS